MRHTFSFLLLLLSISLSGQIRGTVFDKATGLPIQYANVFIKGLDIGTTSDKEGIITLDTRPDNCILIVSAIGYITQEINLQSGEIKIDLTPKIYELPEIKVLPKKHKSQTVNGSINKIKTKSFLSPTGDYPWILTKFFEHNTDYNTTPFIKQIRLLTVCHLDSATFNVRLISVDANGSPDNDLLSSNLIITAKKGENLTAVNLMDYKIIFPENGFFVAFEWLIADQNRVQDSISKRYYYDPMVGIIPAENNTETWRYSKGQWYKSILYIYPNKTVTGQIAVELTLSN